MRPNEAATGEGKHSQREEGSQDGQTMPCGEKHKPQKKLPATAEEQQQQQQQEVVVKARAENEKAAERSEECEAEVWT